MYQECRKAQMVNRGKFRSTGFENYCWNTIRALRFGVVELEKGLADFSCGELVNLKGKVL